MRVTQIADLAGTTPRAVRHYHRLGLLSVPPTVRGGREYGVEHLARLLRIRWLADGGLSLRQVAEILASDPASDEPPVSPAEARRRRVLHDLRAARGTIEAQRRSLDEQAQRVDELIARVEAGQALAPVPVALTRFYDAIEARVRDLEEDPEILRTERQILQVLGSLGMVPDSAVPFVEALDENEIELCAQQVIGFSRLPRLHGEEARQAAHALAERTVELSLRHKDLALAVLDDLPGGVAGRTLWHLTRVLFASGYPDPAQQAFAARLLELLLTSPDLAATFRRSVGEDPVR
ncbi:MerR family transcriptional regulator [Actinomyces massiliensis]|jgi:transcriptional regulator, MerR family|uniref:MerR family transcriptional regulator n=1 Tax=Actinomyces massiliensis TaxID=461393 RepID=UPI0028EF7B78|nr:MerR family transcriptional regulator [Actinomyces massiliensis]